MMTTASIVTYNHTIEDIRPALMSLVNADIAVLYLIDHSNKEQRIKDSFEKFKEECAARKDIPYGIPRFIYIEHKNKGYGSGHNLALKLSILEKSDYHIVVNPDVWFGEEVLPAITAYMDEHPGVGHLMPKVLYPDGSVQRLCKLLPTPLDLIGRFATPRLVAKRNQVFELCQFGYDRRMNVPYLSGCFMFFRTSAIQKVGLFDERFFMYAEDVDMTRRIGEHYSTVFFPDVSIYHKFSRASRRSLKLFFVHAINMVRYFNKWGWFDDEKRKIANSNTLAQFRFNSVR